MKNNNYKLYYKNNARYNYDWPKDYVKKWTKPGNEDDLYQA